VCCCCALALGRTACSWLVSARNAVLLHRLLLVHSRLQHLQVAATTSYDNMGPGTCMLVDLAVCRCRVDRQQLSCAALL
jgi:hypothetical protein